MAAIDILRDILAKRKKPGEVKAEKLPLGTVADLSPRQEETVTLGGTEEVPMDGSLAAVRPRVVPNQPINADVPRPPMPRELDNGGAFDVGVPYADVLAQAPQTPPNLNDPRQRAKYLESKQYNPGEYRKRDGSITNNPNDPDVVETVREPGKDRDKKWSLGEKIGSFFLGMFDGTGAIPAAMDRNYLERRQDRRELADTYGTIQRQQAVENTDAQNEQKRTAAAKNEYDTFNTMRQSAYKDIMSDDLITEDEAKAYNARFGGSIASSDRRQRDVVYDDKGQRWERPKGSTKWELAGAPTDPDKERYETPIGAARPKLSGRDLVNLEVGNTQRQQSTDQFNASKEFEAQKTNIANELKYQDDVRSVLIKIAEANGNVIAGNQDLQIANQRVQEAQAKVNAAAESGDTFAFEEAKKEFDAALDKAVTSLGKVQGGSTIAEQLKKALPKRPPKVTYKPIRPAQVGRPVPSSQDPFKLFQ